MDTGAFFVCRSGLGKLDSPGERLRISGHTTGPLLIEHGIAVAAYFDIGIPLVRGTALPYRLIIYPNRPDGFPHLLR